MFADIKGWSQIPEAARRRLEKFAGLTFSPLNRDTGSYMASTSGIDGRMIEVLAYAVPEAGTSGYPEACIVGKDSEFRFVAVTYVNEESAPRSDSANSWRVRQAVIGNSSQRVISDAAGQNLQRRLVHLDPSREDTGSHDEFDSE